MKKTLSIASAAVFTAGILGCSFIPGSASDAVTVKINGETVNFETQPIIEDGITFVPMRAIFEALGAEVEWDQQTQTVTAVNDTDTMVLKIGSTVMSINGVDSTMAAAPVNEEGYVLVPVRAVSEGLGVSVDWDENLKTVLISSKSADSDEWKSNIGEINLDSMEVSGDGAEVDGNVISITKGGDFTVTGTLSDGMIYVNSEEKVKLRLSGVSITNSTGPAIYFNNAKKAFITITAGTENYLSDTESNTEKAVLFSRGDLEIKGGGSLVVNGNHDHGIASNDDIKIEEGNIIVNAVNDGIHANNTIEILGGSIDVTSEGDGIQAEEDLIIADGALNIITTGEVEENTLYAQTTQSESSASSKGIKAETAVTVSGGKVNINSTDHAFHCSGDINITGGEMTLDSSSGKGISGHGDVTVYDGTINISQCTEGIESKAVLTVNGGNIDIISSDDGLNAGGGSSGFGGGMGGGRERSGGFGGERDIDASIPQSIPESMNGMTPPDRILDGNGIDGEAGTNRRDMLPPDMSEDNGNMSAPPDMPEDNRNMSVPPDMQSGTSTDSGTHEIVINGGNITIDAKGDGIDSNGNIIINGGCILVNGPVSNGDGALDSGDFNSSILINGGEVVAIGSSAMAETADEASAQNTVKITLDNQTAGTVYEVRDGEGAILMSNTSKKEFSSIIYSSSKLETGKTYYIYCDNELMHDITISSASVSAGSAAFGMNSGKGGANRGIRGAGGQIQG